MTIDQIRLQAVNAGSQSLNISGNDLISILNSIPTPSTGGSQWDDVTGGINYADGNVGIGNAAPTVALDVVGVMNISNDSQLNFNCEKSDVLLTSINDTTTFNDAAINAHSDANQSYVAMYASLDDSALLAELALNVNDTFNYSSIVLNANFIKIPQLQDFATNAAAITGGLVAGNMYYTNVAGEATLKIVI